MSTARKDSPDELLRATSRSFHLTLRMLPGAIRAQIGLAYLLARTADTIADTELVPWSRRLDALRRLRERISGAAAAPLEFGELARQQAIPAERALLENVESALARLRSFSSADSQLVRDVLAVITSGQELDLERFEVCSGNRPGSEPVVIALANEAELDDYTYRVAGCVGEFWTRLCRAHLFPRAGLDEARLLVDAVRFGKGLQMVNILRDLPADLRKGRCYLPADRLAQAGLAPVDLLQPTNAPKFRPLYHRYLEMAQAHLAAGWAYTNLLPRGQLRLHLACAWPILIGVQTLARLRLVNGLDPRQRIKISRAQVRRILWYSVLTYPLPGRWRNLFGWAGKAVASSAKLS